VNPERERARSLLDPWAYPGREIYGLVPHPISVRVILNLHPIMNAKILSLLGLVLITPLTIQAGSDSDAFLLKGDAIKLEADKRIVATGHAAVITKAGIRFTAEQLTYNEETGTVKFSGDVTIHAANGSTIPVKELTIDIKGKRVFTLANGNVALSNGSSSMNPQAALTEFSRDFPKTELELRRIEAKP
jgi:lipopolysaccharide assembly outer membrane protein LptD (OstA)